MTDDELSDLACGHGCALAVKRGMATNGACKHVDWRNIQHDRPLFRDVLRALRAWRSRAGELEQENAQLRLKLRESMTERITLVEACLAASADEVTRG
jgi:hypothetical protein